MTTSGPYFALPPILYEDEHLIAFDKPSGLLTVPDRWRKEYPNLVAVVQTELSSSYSNVHRLDKDTSGIVLFAKNLLALKAMTDLFAAHQVAKEYLALCSPAPPQQTGVIDAALSSDPKRPGKMMVTPNGLPSVTEYSVLEQFSEKYALLKARPLTGRTHQVRVHLTHIGCSIMGDAFYGSGNQLYRSELKKNYRSKTGKEKPLLNRLALHAALLSCRHPMAEQELEISSPLPDELFVVCCLLRRWIKG